MVAVQAITTVRVIPTAAGLFDIRDTETADGVPHNGSRAAEGRPLAR